MKKDNERNNGRCNGIKSKKKIIAVGINKILRKMYCFRPLRKQPGTYKNRCFTRTPAEGLKSHTFMIVGINLEERNKRSKKKTTTTRLMYNNIKYLIKKGILI